MAENDFSLSSMSKEEALHLDSTKRCLFPVEDEFPSSTTNADGSLRGISRDEPNWHTRRKSEEESTHSPISVVSVLTIEPPILNNSNNAQNFGDIVPSSSSSASSDEKDNGWSGGVEEQTVIEVQFVEPSPPDDDMHECFDPGHDNLLPSPKRKDTRKIALNNLTTVSRTDIGHARSKPLLDAEKTPSRSQRKKKMTTTPTSLLGCGGCRRYLPPRDDNDCQLVERKITNFLEDNSASTPDEFKTTCTDWQDWSYFGFGKRETPNKERSPSKENIRTTLRRRTSDNLRSRKSNIRQLKQNIAPFVASPARSPARAPGLFRNRSFSVADHRSAIVRVSRDKRHARRSCTDVLELCTMYESVDLESPDVVREHSGTEFEVDDLSYGSDPEDFMRRRQTLGLASVGNRYPLKLKEAQSFGSAQTTPSRSMRDIPNNEVFPTIVQEVFNQTTTLVLHPLPDPHATGLFQPARPVAVDAWLERGQHLAYNLIQPKWIWKAKPKLDAKGQTGVRQKFCLNGIELLDITKILKVEETRGINLPFAKASHCFLIKSIHDEEFFFEAKSRRERDRVVSSLKLLISRFGAKVLTGDPEVYYEFFWMNEGAPGQTPDLREAFCGDVD